MAKFPALVTLDDGRRFLAIWNAGSDLAWHQIFEHEADRSAAWDQINLGTASWDQPSLSPDDVFGILRTSEDANADGWRVRVSPRRMLIVGPLSWPDMIEHQDPITRLIDHHREAEFQIPQAASALFVAAYPGGIVYADRRCETHGDYKQAGFLPYATLQLKLDQQCPADLRPLITAHALSIQRRAGEEFQVSTAGQTVGLGTALDPDQILEMRKGA